MKPKTWFRVTTHAAFAAFLVLCRVDKPNVDWYCAVFLALLVGMYLGGYLAALHARRAKP